MLKAKLENHKKCHRTSAFSKVTIKLPKKKRRVRTESDDSGFGDPLAGEQDIVQSEIGPISVEKKVKVYSLKTHYKYCHSKGRTKKLLHEDADNGVAKQRLGGLDAQMPTMESSYNVSDEFEGAALMTMVGKMEEKITGLKGNFAFIEVAQNAIAAKLGLKLDASPDRKKIRLPCPYRDTTGCLYIGSKKQNLANHIKSHLPEDERKNLVCDRCDKKFADASNLARHKRQIHDKLLIWRCDKCNIASSIKRDLTRHFKTRKHMDMEQMADRKARTSFTTLQLQALENKFRDIERQIMSRYSIEVLYGKSRVGSGQGSDWSASPKIVTGPKILTTV